MPALEAIVGSTTYTLSGGPTYWYVDRGAVRGGPHHRIFERGPQQHGDSDVGFRLNPRLFTITLGVTVATHLAADQALATLDEIFVPRDTPVYLRFTRDDGTARQIACHLADMIEERRAPEHYALEVTIPLRAPDPAFYDPSLQSHTLGIGGNTTGFAVATSVPTGVGATSAGATHTVTYPGSWREYPIVIIYGPITSPVVTNTTTGNKLDFTGTTIAAADYYTIDTRYGYKTVTDAAGTSQISKLTTDSDLTTFHLAPAPDAQAGLNNFSVSGTSITSATEVYLQYYHRYIGV